MALTDLVRRRHSPCAGVAVALPAYAAGEAELDPRSAQHVAQCLRCQAEIVRYRKMLRTLHALRDDPSAPPSRVLADIVGREDGGDPAGGRRLTVLLVGALAAGAAGGAGALLWTLRRQEIATRFSMRSASTNAITTA